MENYFQLFLEGLKAHFLVPFSSEVMLFALKAWDVGPMQVPAALALAGAVAAMMANFTVGRALMHFRNTGQVYVAESIYGKASHLMRGPLLPLLLLCGLNVFPIAVVAAGFLNVPVKRALPVMIAGLAGFYLYVLY